MPLKRRKRSRFPDTRWTLVERALAEDLGARRQALDEMLTLYTPGLHAFLIESRRIPSDLAGDLLQDFVTDKILSNKILHHVVQGKGRFRNYLLKSLNNFVTTRLAREHAIGVLVEIDSDLFGGPARPETDRFDRMWVQQLVRDALGRMREECGSTGRLQVWQIFQLRVVGPMLHDEEPVDYATLVERLHIDTPRQAINLLVTAKRIFLRHLRAAIGRYVSGDDEIERELADLRDIAGR